MKRTRLNSLNLDGLPPPVQRRLLLTPPQKIEQILALFDVASTGSAFDVRDYESSNRLPSGILRKLLEQLSDSSSTDQPGEDAAGDSPLGSGALFGRRRPLAA